MFKKKTGSVFTQFLPDGNGEFANGMGYLCQMRHVNYGPRSWRYSMVVDNLNYLLANIAPTTKNRNVKTSFHMKLLLVDLQHN